MVAVALCIRAFFHFKYHKTQSYHSMSSIGSDIHGSVSLHGKNAAIFGDGRKF
jgi:hypothetical protein